VRRYLVAEIGSGEKALRLLTMYSRLVDGKLLKKEELSIEFGITQRSVQRDLETLRIFFAEEMLGKELIYDRRLRGFRLSRPSWANSQELD
jgi:predicted DNA-binding transcriptional regulator YafY